MTHLAIRSKNWFHLPVKSSEPKTRHEPPPDLRGRVDTFVSPGCGAFIRKALHLSPKLQDMSTESLVRLARDTVPNKLDFPKLETALRRAGSGDLGQLWYGICLRLRGESCEAVLAPLLHHETYGRTAWVNIIAAFLNRPFCDPERAEQYLEAISAHNTLDEQDPCTRLLQSLLLWNLNRRPAALEVVEKLYLESPMYTPSISVMASYLFVRGLYEGSKSFATEALEKCQDNAQALAILRRQTNPFDWDDIDEKFSHVRTLVAEVLPKSILYCKYSMLDPSC